MCDDSGLSASQKELALHMVRVLEKHPLTDEELQTVAGYKDRLSAVLAEAILSIH